MKIYRLSFAELANVCILFMTLPVSVATAESHSLNSRLLKTLRSTIAQERLDSLAMLSIIRLFIWISKQNMLKFQDNSRDMFSAAI